MPILGLAESFKTMNRPDPACPARPDRDALRRLGKFKRYGREICIQSLF